MRTGKKKTCESPQVTVSARFAHVAISKKPCKISESFIISGWEDMRDDFPLNVTDFHMATDPATVKPLSGSYTDHPNSEIKTKIYSVIKISLY